jgi:uncharacterized protein YaiI (UPF0178 family)
MQKAEKVERKKLYIVMFSASGTCQKDRKEVMDQIRDKGFDAVEMKIATQEKGVEVVVIG